MKALIFNSGIGKRMGELTRNNPKCMVKLYNGETIFERQLRILSECGIRDFVVTTGPYKEQLTETAKKFDGLHISFVDNPKYETTNYIVSMDNAYDFLDDDFLMLHGDLVFNKGIVQKMLENREASVCLYNEQAALPEKDFKGRFQGGLLKEVSIHIFDDDCYTFQPLYKLSKKDLTLWKDEVRRFVENGTVTVYAENALNEISDRLHIVGMSFCDDFVEEIDNAEDYERVSGGIKLFDYREQIVEQTDDYAKTLGKYGKNGEELFVVCSSDLKDAVTKRLSTLGCRLTVFGDFTANPQYEDVKKGVDLFKSRNCKTIVSIGGGSSIDTAKCIKLFSALENETDFLEKKYRYNNIVHIAVPTTAGTGSESTQFSVVYYESKKLSIDHGSILPQVAILDHSFLTTLPDYQKKSTLLDALSQAIESYWSKGATAQSRDYSAKSIDLILKHYRAYFAGSADAQKQIMLAANFSGKAINITRTTAPHAMSYKLTSLYRVSHGHAVALCLIPCWELLAQKAAKDRALETVLTGLAEMLGQKDIEDSISFVRGIIEEFDLPKVTIDPADLDLLTDSVNVERLGNNPILFTRDELRALYSSL